MAKVDPRHYTKTERKVLKEVVLSTLRALDAGDESLRFLSDLFTESEFVMFARRIQIAKRLLAGCSYARIRGELRVGLDTIQGVHEWLDGKFENYRRVIPPLRTLKDVQLQRELRRAYSGSYWLLRYLVGRDVAEKRLRAQVPWVES